MLSSTISSPVDNPRGDGVVSASVCVMRWDELFDDLEAQLEHELAHDELDLRAEDERLRLGRLTLRDRLLALTALDPEAVPLRDPVSLRLRSGDVVRMTVETIGRDWLVGELPGRTPAQQVLVPFAAIGSVRLTSAEVAVSLTPSPAVQARITDRLGIAFVLRDLCRRRAGVHVVSEGGETHGTIDRVGRDHLDLAVHEPGSQRRERDVAEYRIVPFDSLVSVRL